MPSSWPHTSWNSRIEFSSNQNADTRRYVIDGWSTPQPSGLLSERAIARLAFSLCPPRHSAFLVLEVTPFLSYPRVAHQPLEVLLNGVMVGRSDLVFPRRTVLIFPIDPALLRSRRAAIITFLLPGACSQGDTNLLNVKTPGMLLHWLTWTDILCEYQIGSRIPATSTYPGNPFLLYGWSYSERGFTWSEGRAAGLLLRPNAQLDGLVLEASIAPFHPATEARGLLVHVSVNERPAGYWRFRDGSQVVKTVKLPAGVIGPDRHVYVRFDIHEPRSPREAGHGNDGRELGFKLVDFALLPGESADPDTLARMRTAVPTVLPTTELSFCAGKVQDRSLVYGWGPVGPDGVLTTNPIALIALQLPAPQGFMLELNMRCLTGDSCPVAVSVMISETWICEWRVSNGDFAPYVAAVPPGIVDARFPVYLKLVLRFGVGRTEPDCSDGGVVLRCLRVEPRAREEALPQPAIPFLLPGTTVCFGEGQTGAHFLDSEWMPARTWAQSFSSRPTIRFRVGTLYLPAVVALRIAPAEEDGLVAVGELRVEVNGRPAASFTFQRPGLKCLLVRLHAVDLSDGSIWLRLRLINPACKTTLVYPSIALHSLSIDHSTGDRDLK